jgi:hypothetical protein
MLTLIEKMQGDDEEDTRLLKEMAERARRYIAPFHWCLPITETYFAWGIGHVIALFLFKFEDKIGETDDKLWVVVGDLPSAYMVVLPSQNAREVLENYCSLMDDWVSAVRNNGNFADVFPVMAARTEEHADMLESRLAFLRKEIIPEAPADLMTDANGEIVARERSSDGGGE